MTQRQMILTARRLDFSQNIMRRQRLDFFGRDQGNIAASFERDRPGSVTEARFPEPAQVLHPDASAGQIMDVKAQVATGSEFDPVAEQALAIDAHRPAGGGMAKKVDILQFQLAT